MVQIVDSFDKARIESYNTYGNIENRSQKLEVDFGAGLTFLFRNQFEKLNINVCLEPLTIAFRSHPRRQNIVETFENNNYAFSESLNLLDQLL